MSSRLHIPDDPREAMLADAFAAVVRQPCPECPAPLAIKVIDHLIYLYVPHAPTCPNYQGEPNED